MNQKNKSKVNRRTAIAAAATTTMGGAAVVLSAGTAQAATGQPVIQGGVNNAGAGSTTLTSTSSLPALAVKNNGSGAGALFQAVNSNGFAGGTFHGDRYGLSAANSGAAGTGAAMAASGGNNTGVLANTNNAGRYGVIAANRSANLSFGAGLLADGGVNYGIVALGAPAVLSDGDIVLYGASLLVGVAGETEPAVFGSWSATPDSVTLAGTATLDGSGNATITPGADTAWAIMDLSGASSFVSANSAAMPNLYISVDAVASTIKINGGAASGTVSYQVTAVRTILGAAATTAPDAHKRAAKVLGAAGAAVSGTP